MFRVFNIPHDIFDHENFKTLRLSSIYLYCYLAKLKNWYEDPDGWFWRSMVQICDDMGISMKTLKIAKKELKQHNFIEVKRGTYNGSNKRSADCYKVLGFKEDLPRG